MKAYTILLILDSGRHFAYIVSAKNEDIAIDACVRACLQEQPNATFKSQYAYEVSLDTPLKIMD